MQVDDKLAKEKLARLVEVFNLGTLPYDGDKIADAAQLIRNTDLTDCAPDQGSVRNATDELRDTKRLDWMIAHDWHFASSRDDEYCWLVRYDDDGEIVKQSGLFTSGRDAIDAAIRALPDQKD